MRKDPFAVGSFIHVYNRGNRKQPIVKDAKDRWHFLQMLFYFNNRFSPSNIFRELRKLLKSDFNRDFNFIWPENWPGRQPIVKILSFGLADNHFHLIMKEIKQGGVTMFMRKLGTGMTNYYNTKYQETGRLFQGAYKARLVNTDNYLKYLSVYVQVKNILELYPGGMEKALNNFEDAFKFASKYPYCSLADYVGYRSSPIIEKDLLGEIFNDPKEYKRFAKDCMFSADFDEKIKHLIE